jgi:hypothetical protein
MVICSLNQYTEGYLHYMHCNSSSEQWEHNLLYGLTFNDISIYRTRNFSGW